MPALLRPLFLLLLIPLLSGCLTSSGPVRSGTAKVVTTTDNLGPPDTTTDTGAYIGTAEYRIGDQDLLEITVFQIEDLNKTVRVNSSGQLSLPLIGTIQAGGLTVKELEDLVAAKLSESYLQDPQVSVFVKEFSSQRITVEGAIGGPGIYPLKGRTTLLQALATAGGVSDLANLQAIVVFRKVGGQKMAAVFDLQAIRGGNAEDPQVYGDDVIVVDVSGPRSTMRRFLEAVSAFNVFRPY
jgi:polysaccharide export outer membrane protein